MLGSEPASGGRRGLCQPRCAARTVASNLRRGKPSGADSPEAFSGEAGAAVHPDGGSLRHCGIRHGLVPGDEIRPEMVGLQRIFHEYRRKNLCGRTPGIWPGGTGHRLSHCAAAGQPPKEGEPKGSSAGGHHADQPVLLRSDLFGEAPQHGGRHLQRKHETGGYENHRIQSRAESPEEFLWELQYVGSSCFFENKKQTCNGYYAMYPPYCVSSKEGT